MKLPQAILTLVALLLAPSSFLHAAGRYRLIRSVKDEGAFLFDDVTDPENLKNIAADHADIVKSLGAAIDEWLKQTGERLPPKSM